MKKVRLILLVAIALSQNVESLSLENVSFPIKDVSFHKTTCKYKYQCKRKQIHCNYMIISGKMIFVRDCGPISKNANFKRIKGPINIVGNKRGFKCGFLEKKEMNNFDFVGHHCVPLSDNG